MSIGEGHPHPSTALGTKLAAPRLGEDASTPPSLAVADTVVLAGLSHLPALDGLRAVAVLGVLAFHVTVMGGFRAESLLESTLQYVAVAGRNGVDLFFVLSGFLITAILLSTRDLPGYFLSFYTRRALRLAPAYYVFLAIIAGVCMFEPTLRQAMARSWPWYVAYLTNFQFAFFEQEGVELVRHLWSLAIEEQFYLLWPVVIAWVPRRALLTFTCIAVALVIVGRCWWAQQQPSSVALYMATWSRADALLLGAVLALARTHTATWTVLVRSAPFALVLSVGCMGVPGLMAALDTYAGETSLFAVQFAALITLCVGADERGAHIRWLCHPFLQRLGQLSYGLYLVHFPIALYVAPWGNELPLPAQVRWPLTLALVAGASYFLAALSFRFVETPFLRLKGHVPRPGAVMT